MLLCMYSEHDSNSLYGRKLCSIFGKQNVYIDPPSGAQPSNQFTLEQLISTPHKLQPNQYVGYGKSILELLILSDVKILLLAWAYGNRRLNGNRAKVHYLNSNFKPRKGFGFREEGRFFSKISFLVNVLTPEDPWWPHRWHQQQGVVHRVWCDDVYLDNTVETLLSARDRRALVLITWLRLRLISYHLCKLKAAVDNSVAC